LFSRPDPWGEEQVPEPKTKEQRNSLDEERSTENCLMFWMLGVAETNTEVLA